jgi:hypothetical protein
MNFIKDYFLPALVFIAVAALLIFGFQFLAQTGWAVGVRETAASTPPEIGDAPATLTDFFASLGISTVRMTLFIGLPFAVTSVVLKRTQKS